MRFPVQVEQNKHLDGESLQDDTTCLEGRSRRQNRFIMPRHLRREV